MNDVVGLRKYGKALEESFFEQENQRLLEKLREEAAREKKRATLREALKLDDTVLDHLVELDLTPETIVAFSLVPLVEVAWADGEIQDRERDAILRAADSRGISAGSISHQLLGNWLRRQPTATLLEVWKHYAKALMAALDPDARRAMRERTIGGAQEVAEAAGGFLGIGSISAAEKAVLRDLESALS